MELEFTEEQDHLRANVRDVLTRECPMTLVRAVVEKGASPEKLWATMVSLDWPSLAIEEQHGGLGLDFVDLAVVLEELGRAVGLGPFVPTLTQFVPFIREAGSLEQQARFLGAVARGECTGSVVLEGGYAMEAGHVDEIVATTADGRLVVVPAADATIEPVAALDASRQLAKVTFDESAVAPDRVLAVGPGGRARALEEATTALALEMLGTCQAIFDMTLEYAKARHQFGVPIGSFQAIKHKLADMFVMLERARATAYYAAATIAEDDPRRTAAASMAKAAVGDAQRMITQEGIQIHGGVGYTWEHDLHLLVKRAKASDALLGTPADHRARLASLLFDPALP